MTIAVKRKPSWKLALLIFFPTAVNIQRLLNGGGGEKERGGGGIFGVCDSAKVFANSVKYWHAFAQNMFMFLLRSSPETF